MSTLFYKEENHNQKKSNNKQSNNPIQPCLVKYLMSFPPSGSCRHFVLINSIRIIVFFSPFPSPPALSLFLVPPIASLILIFLYISIHVPVRAST